jgi:hypothetical protein
MCVTQLLEAAQKEAISTELDYMDDGYAASVMELLQQNYNGRTDFSQGVSTTIEELLGKPPIRPRLWAATHKTGLLAAAVEMQVPVGTVI